MGYDAQSEIQVIDSTMGFQRRFVTERPISALAFGSDGLLYTGYGSANIVDVYDPDTGARLRSFSTRDAIDAMTFGPTGRLYVGADGARGIEVYDPSTGIDIRQEIPTTNALTALAFDRSGFLFSGDDGYREINKHDVVARAEIAQFVVATAVDAIAVTQSNEVVIASAAQTEFSVYDSNSGAELRRFGIGVSVDAMVIDGGTLIVGNDNRQDLQFFDLATGSFLRSVLTGNTPVSAMAIRPTQVSEPGTLATLLGSVLAMAAWRRRLPAKHGLGRASEHVAS